VLAGVFQVTLHAYELSALVAAARWVAESGKGELPEESLRQLRHVLDSYDNETKRLNR
jgi:predicted DNA-binding transcriptional regulator YafY